MIYMSHVFVDGEDNPYPGGAVEYERRVIELLNTIKATGTGKALLGFFALRARNVWILPPAGNRSRPNDAGAYSEHLQDAFRRNFDLRSGGDGHILPGRRHGTGAGTDSLLRFHPIHWSPAINATTPEQVLVHELFHSMRQTFGALRNSPMGAGFDTVEELYSIFVENMYLFEKGLTLRPAHSGETLSSPDHSMARNPAFHAPMRDLLAMMPTIFNALAAVPIRYNPFKDWLDYARSHQGPAGASAQPRPAGMGRVPG